MRSIEVEIADVYRDEAKVGTLERTAQGCRFTYNGDYTGEKIAFHLPLGDPIEWVGDNLPPFFANLLPEGVRLQALINRARTSPSDMFSLLIEAGPECVGDIYVLPAGTTRRTEKHPTKRAIKNLDFTELLADAIEGADDASIPGVQDKLSISDSTINMPLSTGTSSAILKLSPSAFPYLVENEAFFLQLAKLCGFNVPRFKIVTDIKGRTGLLVDRFDRYKDANGLRRIHQEDGCQMTDKYPADKYRLSMRSMVEATQMYVNAEAPQTLELVMRYVFSYLIGNGDLHAKNISLTQHRSSSLTGLTPMYDVVCTLLYPSLDQRMALPIDGKDNRFKLADFVRFGERHGLKAETLTKDIVKLTTKLEPLIARVGELSFEPKDIERTQNLMRERISDLKTN